MEKIWNSKSKKNSKIIEQNLQEDFGDNVNIHVSIPGELGIQNQYLVTVEIISDKTQIEKSSFKTYKEILINRQDKI